MGIGPMDQSDEVHEGSVNPQRSLAETCSVLEANSFNLFGDDLEGNYVQDPNQFLYGRPVFRHAENSAVIYWTEVEFARRRLEGREEGGGGGGVFEAGRLREWQSARVAGARKTDYYLIGDHEGQEMDSPAWFHGPLVLPDTSQPGPGGDVGGHEFCTDGAWVVAPDDGTFPLYAVLDCARHPVDVTSDDWYIGDCATCALESTYISFYFWCTTLSSLDTPAPMVTRSPSATYSPAINVIPQIATISPGAVVVIDNNSTCDSVVVSNSDDDGEYFAVGEPVDGRYVWERNSTTSTLFWNAGSIQRRLHGERKQDEQLDSLGASFGPRRWWRALRGQGWGRPLPKSDHRGTSPLERATRRILTGGNTVGRRSPDSRTSGEGLDAAGEALAMANKEGKAILDSSSPGRCDDGYWELESDSGTRIVALDCALHPADVTTFWYDVGGYIYYIDTTIRTPLVTVECSGEGSSSSSPSAGVGLRNTIPDVEEGAPGAPSTAISGDSSSSNDNLTVHVIIAISAGLVVCLLACLGAWCRMGGTRKEKHKLRVHRDPASEGGIAELPLPASRTSVPIPSAPVATLVEEESGRAAVVSGTSEAKSSAEVTEGDLSEAKAEGGSEGTKAEEGERKWGYGGVECEQ